MTTLNSHPRRLRVSVRPQVGQQANHWRLVVWLLVLVLVAALAVVTEQMTLGQAIEQGMSALVSIGGAVLAQGGRR